jgi:hypothetical protein
VGSDTRQHEAVYLLEGDYFRLGSVEHCIPKQQLPGYKADGPLPQEKALSNSPCLGVRLRR